MGRRVQSLVPKKQKGYNLWVPNRPELQPLIPKQETRNWTQGYSLWYPKRAKISALPFGPQNEKVLTRNGSKAITSGPQTLKSI